MEAEARMAAPMKIEENLNKGHLKVNLSQFTNKWPIHPLLLYIMMAQQEILSNMKGQIFYGITGVSQSH